MKNAATWTWIRHAPASLQGRFCGRTDAELDESISFDYGIAASALTAGSRVFVSPLARARQTLDKFVEAGFQPGAVETNALLAEQDFGTCEGKPYDAITLPDSAESLAAWRPDGGEAFADVVDRVRSFMESRIAHADVSLFCHAGTIRAALAVALDIPGSRALGFTIEPLSRTALVRLEGGSWHISHVNRIGATT